MKPIKFATALSLRRRPTEKISQPSIGGMLIAESDNGKRNRKTDEGAKQAAQKGSEEDVKRHYACERARLYIAALITSRIEWTT